MSKRRFQLLALAPAVVEQRAQFYGLFARQLLFALRVANQRRHEAGDTFALV